MKNPKNEGGGNPVARALAFTAVGLIFRRWLADRRRLTITLFAAFWIVVYAFYWTMI